MLKFVRSNKNLIKKGSLQRRVATAKFSETTQSQSNLDIFPDQILDHIKEEIVKAAENPSEIWDKIESEIIERINYFDSDQFCDLIILLGKNDVGSEHLWDLISYKIFDHELDYPQTLAVSVALKDTLKPRVEFVYDDLYRNIITSDVIYGKKVQLYKNLFH